MSWDDDISGPHREIASSTHRKIGVLAGPGTGKTSYGLMRRVVRLLESGVPGSRILLLSFTRVAAADLRDKVSALEVPGADEVRATTLHGYCFRLLQSDSVLAITGRIPRILLAHEADLMLRDIGGNYGSIYDRRRLLEAFVAGWARELQDHPGASAAKDDQAFEGAVMLWLREHRAMLIGEVIPESYRYLVTNPAAAEHDAFDHVIVDEYQDLNALEQRLLDHLAETSAICIAGDDDQSIYSVRYANPEGILTYLARDDVEAHTINVCGRCPENILMMARSLIGHSLNRDKADLESLTPGSAGPIAIVQWQDPDVEADGIVANIAADLSSERYEPGQILVLTNWRKIGERVRARLDNLGVPCRSYFTEEELNTDEAKEALAYLRLVVDDEDAPALRVILGLGDASGRTEAYQRLLAFCRANAATPRAVLARLASGESLPLNIRALVIRYSGVMARVEQLRALKLEKVVDALFPEDQVPTGDLRAVAVESLAEAEGSADLLRAMVEAITQDDVPQNPGFVRIMSLHKSKGLTADCVYVIGAVHGVLPTVRDDDPTVRAEAESEGRRLFYVAVTRAATELIISSSVAMDLADANARGVKYDRDSIRRAGDHYIIRTIASPYIAELGAGTPRPVRGIEWLRRR